jgi:integrase
MAPRKRGRRKPGTGAIRRKGGATDRPFEAAFPLGHGRYRYDYFPTEAEAAQHLDELTAARESGRRNMAGGAQTVEVFLVAWLNQKAKTVKAKTLDNYKLMCSYANGYFGSTRVDAVRRDDLVAAVEDMEARGSKSAPQFRRVMHAAFEDAAKWQYRADNPAQHVTTRTVERRTGLAMTRAQLDALYAASADTWLGPLWRLYGSLGLRKGEGAGLRWADYDEVAGTLTIAQQYTELRGKATKDTPKSKRSRRTIPVSPELRAALRQHRERQRAHAATPEWQEHGLMFPSRVGTPMGPRNLRREYDALLAAAGIPPHFTIHDLRHTAEYHMEQDGVPESVRMALLGHSTSRMARHYADHARDDMPAMRKAVERRAG